MLTKEAHETLELLGQGAKFNCLSVTSRELISAGLAFDGWGYLEISEAGRRVLRREGSTMSHFAVDSPNISNMGDRNEPMKVRDLAHYDSLREAPPEPVTMNVESNRGGRTFELSDRQEADQVDRNQPTLKPAIEMAGVAWSRKRAIAAAGVANGAVGVWVDQRWVQAFLLAYEAER
jgi:hypothetical protein